jgi:DNA-binding PadR family transcriptional regulator
MSLVGREGAGPHDIRRMVRTGGRLYWTAGESLYYSEPKRLAALGYLSATKGPGKTRERTHYTLTAKGIEALRAWAAEPSAFPRIQNEAAAKVMSADLVGEEAVLAGVGALRADLAELSALVDEAEAAAEAIPHRTKYLRLNHRYARRLVEVHREWLDEVERELGSGPAARTGTGRAKRPRGAG